MNIQIKDVKVLQKGLRTIADGLYIIASTLEVEPREYDEIFKRQEEKESKLPSEKEMQKEVDELEAKRVSKDVPEDLDGATKLNLDEEAPINVAQEDREEEIEQVTEEDGVPTLTGAVLNEMSYRDLQKMAKDLDILATGKKEDLVERLVGKSVEAFSEELESVVEEVVELQEEEAPVTQEEPTDLPEEEEVETIEEAEEKIGVIEENNHADQIANILIDYSEEDLADTLSDLGLSPKGKRQALLAKIVKAYDDGLIEIDLSDDTEEEEEVEVVEVEPKEVEVEVEVDMYEGMTEARKTSVTEIRLEVARMIADKEIGREDMIDTLITVYDEGGIVELPDDELKDIMLDFYSDLVDDEGVQHDMKEPYERGDKYVCCTQDLETLKNGHLQCPVCETDYELS